MCGKIFVDVWRRAMEVEMWSVGFVLFISIVGLHSYVFGKCVGNVVVFQQN